MRRQERDRTRLRTAALAGGALAAWSLCAVLAAPPKLASQKTPAPSEVKAPPQAATNAAVPKTNAVPSATRQNPYRSIALRNPFG
ncbi:MAG: hypothetical protein J7M29_00145, partial [Verrucomicrobia bacterium]|nr:hypothetical protein [Verrucomicrobiota bacterium]